MQQIRRALIREALIRFGGAFLVVVLSSAAGAAYMAIYSDEIAPGDPANLGKGLLAPMYRHWIEFVVVIWTAFLTVAVGYYLVFGSKMGIVINWPVVRPFMSRLHFVSGSLIMASLLIALITGQPMHLRDMILAFVGLGLLAIVVWERVGTPRYPSST